MPADAKSPKKLGDSRAALTHKIDYALRHHGSVTPYLSRDAWLRLKHPDHVGYNRAAMASDTHRNLEAAVGSQTHERWLALGQMQFDYLVEHGLRPEHRMLDVDCGNQPRRLALHRPHRYRQLPDISPDILMAAKK